uniref:Uncharacterized protein n=1 Tax=Arundo donax TaxID=35708 RepID=A0A0A8ZWI2_ARUDO
MSITNYRSEQGNQQCGWNKGPAVQAWLDGLPVTRGQLVTTRSEEGDGRYG